MSLKTVTERHTVQHTRPTVTAGPAGGQIEGEIDLGSKLCTINPDSDFESLDFEQRNEQLGISIYFNYNPQVVTNDLLTHVGTRDAESGIMETVTNGDVYRVQSHLNFQRQNRLWRVRATKQPAINR